MEKASSKNPVTPGYCRNYVLIAYLAGKRSRKGGKKGEDRASMIRNIKKIHDDARLHLRAVLRTMIPVTARVTARYSGSCALKCRDAIVSAVSGAPRNNGNMGGQSAGDSFCMIRQIIGQPRQHLLTARRKACQGCSTGLSCLLARGSCATLMCEVHHYPPKEMAADVGASHADARSIIRACTLALLSNFQTQQVIRFGAGRRF